MNELTGCDRCRLCAHSPYLVCAVHPNGPDFKPCPDFEECPPDQQRPLMGGYFYDNWLPLLTNSSLHEDEWTGFWISEDAGSRE
ncbi:MAG TPA: hypothetical protein V6D07_12275 [Trichocoleus sp.]